MAKMGIYDYAFLVTETADSPKHVAGLQIFEPPKNYRGDYVSDLIEALRARPPGGLFKLKLKPGLPGSAEWVEDEAFDLDYHLRHARLPRPGNNAQLMDLVGRLHSVLLDRQRPLWELHVIEGLEGGRFALYAKIHHSYCDGITLVRLMMGTLNTSPDDTTLYASWESRHEAPLRARARSVSERLQQGAGLVRRGFTSAFQLSGLAARFALQSVGVGHSKFPIPFTAPRTKLNATVTRARRAAVGQLPLSELKALAHATETTLNDVIVTLCDIALTRYLQDHKDAPATPLVAQIPVSLRREGEHQLGNQIAILPVTLGHAGRDPLKRLGEIHESSSRLKAEASGMSADSVSMYTLAIQGAAQAAELLGLNEAVPPLGNVLISNVPGPREPLYLWRSLLVASYPLSAIPPGLAMNITVFSYQDKFDVGVIGGYDAIPDIECLPAYMADGLRALQSAVARRDSRRRSGAGGTRASGSRDAPAKVAGKKRAAGSAPARKTAGKKIAGKKTRTNKAAAGPTRDKKAPAAKATRKKRSTRTTKASKHPVKKASAKRARPVAEPDRG